MVWLTYNYCYNVGMVKQDFLSVLITLAVGLFAGFYLYLAGFAGVVADMSVPDRIAVSEFTIVGDVYGGCRDACPSFQVVNGGSYRYFYTPEAGAEQILRQGTLPLDLQRQLKLTLTKDALSVESEQIEPSFCDSYADGIDILYEVTLNDEKFILDSCGTAVVAEGSLWTTLSSIWAYFETL